MDELAHIIGAHGTMLLLGLIVATLAAIALLWRVLPALSRRLWPLLSGLWRRFVELPVVRALRERYPWLWQFFAKRLSPEGYLGLHVTIGFLLILGVLSLFTGIADEIEPGGDVARFDSMVAMALHDQASPLAVRAFHALTWLGDTMVLTGIGVGVGLFLVMRREWLLLAGWALALGGGGLINAALKAFFQRARPSLPNPFALETSFSFPSGHAMGSILAYGMLAYLLIHGAKRPLHRPIVILAAALVGLIGASRLYLGVHYASDVFAGYLAGSAWLVTCITGIEIARRHQRSRAQPVVYPAQKKDDSLQEAQRTQRF